MELEKLKQFIKEMQPTKFDLVLLIFSLVTGAIALDLNLKNTFNVAEIIFDAEIVVTFCWLTCVIGYLIIKKHKDRKAKKQNVNEQTKNQ